MIDKYLLELLERGPDRPLDNLESDIWRGEARQAEAWRAQKFVASCQVGALVLAIVASSISGISLADKPRPTGAPTLLGDGIELAPSSRLLGITS